MIVLTGAAGFIGSYVCGYFNRKGINNFVLVDDFEKNKDQKQANWVSKSYQQLVDRAHFPTWFAENAAEVELVIHLGARTDTTEFDTSIFDELNLNYSKKLWQLCTLHQIPFIYASSAATYGGGEHGFDDDLAIVPLLKPLNPYGQSKQDFDTFALSQTTTPPFWAGLKFFNVYGPNEYHKGRMASVVLHTFNQIKNTGKMSLFKSHNPNFEDGEQLRDFIYVEDLAQIIEFLANNQLVNSGLYNVGTGTARSFIDLATAVFKALNLSPDISFVDTPADIRDNYQYFTEAKMNKLIQAGYSKPFTSLEAGVTDYVTNYLNAGLRY